MSTNFLNYAAPSSEDRAKASLYESGGFDDAPPPSSTPAPGGSSFISQSLSNRTRPLIETKNSHLLGLERKPDWQTDDGVAHSLITVPSSSYLIPHLITPRARFFPTSGTAAPNCNTCKIVFDFFTRRHHVSRICTQRSIFLSHGASCFYTHIPSLC